jgi:hypothetical protein
MNFLFQDLRKLLNPNRRREASPVLDFPPALREALYAMDRSNRGHAHLLEDGTRPKHAPFDDAANKRRWALQDSLNGVLRALLTTPAKQLPKYEPFQAWLHRPVASEWLSHMARCYIARDPAGLPSEISVQSSCNWLDGKPLQSPVTIARTYKLRGTNLQATRSTTIEVPYQPGTLMETVELIQKFQAAAQAEVANILEWPEFSAAARKRYVLDKARTSVRNLFQGYNAEERKIVMDAWPELKAMLA